VKVLRRPKHGCLSGELQFSKDLIRRLRRMWLDRDATRNQSNYEYRAGAKKVHARELQLDFNRAIERGDINFMSIRLSQKVKT
jgi:hypothetical protein